LLHIAAVSLCSNKFKPYLDQVVLGPKPQAAVVAAAVLCSTIAAVLCSSSLFQVMPRVMPMPQAICTVAVLFLQQQACSSSIVPTAAEVQGPSAQSSRQVSFGQGH